MGPGLDMERSSKFQTSLIEATALKPWSQNGCWTLKPSTLNSFNSFDSFERQRQLPGLGHLGHLGHRIRTGQFAFQLQLPSLLGSGTDPHGVKDVKDVKAWNLVDMGKSCKVIKPGILELANTNGYKWVQRIYLLFFCHSMSHGPSISIFFYVVHLVLMVRAMLGSPDACFGVRCSRSHIDQSFCLMFSLLEIGLVLHLNIFFGWFLWSVWFSE